ncbi:MAG: hypothetical protein LAO09_06035 [Acidobacteriia bacterium]|nr:hypothetical protein [Terriglobia bacterium]
MASENLDQATYVERLKRQFAAATAKHRVVAAGPSADSADDEAARKEHELFVKRLRFRLKEAGVSGADISGIEKQAIAPAAYEKPSLAAATTAILVVHGIGEQDRYEPLDQFARNLTRYLRHEGGIDDLTLSARKIDHNDWVEASIRLETAAHGPRTEEGRSSATIDLYEYYWAPQTEDKISYLQTISWLIKTTLTPIRMLDQNVRAIKNAPDAEELSVSAIYWRELQRIAWLYLPLAGLLALLVLWLPSALKFRDTLKTVAAQWNADHPVVRLIMTLLFAVSLVMFWVVSKQLATRLLRKLRRQTAMIESWVLTKTSVVAALLGAAGIAIGQLLSVDLCQYFHPILNFNVLKALGIFVIARGLQLFLANFVGDVAVYVNTDDKARNYLVRRAVLSGAAQAITRILRGGYDRVIVAGHSLGSVIAYDSLNELMNRCLRKDDRDDALYAIPDQIVDVQPPAAALHRADLKKITGLVTFGSPLDKVHYFFRENVPQEQTVRAQILAFMRSFRTRGSGNDYGIYRLEKYKADQLSSVKWLNAWSKQDPVSGMLHFYKPVIRRQFTYSIPIYAHLSYWEDLRFYEFFAEPLLFDQLIPPAQDMQFAIA